MYPSPLLVVPHPLLLPFTPNSPPGSLRTPGGLASIHTWGACAPQLGNTGLDTINSDWCVADTTSQWGLLEIWRQRTGNLGVSKMNIPELSRYVRGYTIKGNE